MNYLTTKLYNAIKNPTLIQSRRGSSGLNPSAASVKISNNDETRVVGACQRQQFYRVKGFKEDHLLEINVDWALAAMMGDQMHKLMSELIDNYGFAMGLQRIAAEHSIYNSMLNLRGRSDLILWDTKANEPVGVEIKSVGEYKSKEAMESPIEEHVLQSVVYLHHYNTHIPNDQKKITKWYIWYICRTENWTTKSKAHGSDITNMWDFCIELQDGIPVITTASGKQKWTDFSIIKINERYRELLDYLDKNLVPPRDYEIIYSEEKIAGLYKKDKLARKTDKDIVEKWLDKGAKPGALKLVMGDFECKVCDYKDRCWQGKDNKDIDMFSNLPKILQQKNTNDDGWLVI